MSKLIKDLGAVSAYAYAVEKGYTGTEDEFAELMADYASVGQSAAQSAEQAAASATSASGFAATASEAAQTATDKASEAVTAAGTSTTKASEASESATTATTAKTDAESARDAAAQSASEAAESARTLTIDPTFTQSGQAADAKETGDKITSLKEDFNDLDDRVFDLESGGGGGSAAPMESITWSELKAKRDGGTLTPGMQYRITDYVCTTTQEESRAISHPYDIIVTADNANTLNESARACLHDGDNYYSAEGHSANLKAWELKYCLDNDTSRFAWADETNGKGVVYYLKDEKGNECPYDFKQIQFKRYKITECEKVPSLVGSYTAVPYSDSIGGIDEDNPIWVYIFNYYNEHIEDATVLGLQHDDDGRGEVLGNKIALAYDGDRMALNNIVFLGHNTYNTFGNDCTCNTFGANCTGNAFGAHCSGNTFGANCTGNAFGNSCYGNTFGNDCTDNTFGNSCSGNAFGDSCSGNTFDYNCTDNTFGNSCSGNTFGNDCTDNTFGNDCYGNAFGYNCTDNTFGNDCYGNAFGTKCYGNAFGAHCYGNTFGNDCGGNTFGNDCYGNVLERDCAYLNGTRGENDRVTHSCHVLAGTSGSSGELYELPTVSMTDRSVIYVGVNPNGNIITWVPADDHGQHT